MDLLNGIVTLRLSWNLLCNSCNGRNIYRFIEIDIFLLFLFKTIYQLLLILSPFNFYFIRLQILKVYIIIIFNFIFLLFTNFIFRSKRIFLINLWIFTLIFWLIALITLATVFIVLKFTRFSHLFNWYLTSIWRIFLTYLLTFIPSLLLNT